MASENNCQHSLEASLNGMTHCRVYQEETQLSTDHYVDEDNIATDTRESGRTRFIYSSNKSSSAASSTIVANDDAIVTTRYDSCNLLDERNHYDWELVDKNVLQAALNFRKELISWHNDNKKLKQQIYTINKGYLTLRLDHITDKKQIDTIRNFFKQAMQECDPRHIVKAYSLSQSFSKLLNKDMARIVLHDIDKGCSKFSCDTLYTTQEGTKSIASILFYHPGFITYHGTVYRGIFDSRELANIQVNRCIMTNTFLSTSKLPEIADIFAAYNRTEHKLDQGDKEGEVSIGCTFIIKNINGNRRALDIS
ncbi:unnamed protein product, partial [Rotaria sp. Silwood2]